MIANYVNEQHDTWDQFLRDFAYAIRTAVNETTGKTPAELFLGRKLITPFQKLVMVSDGTEFAVPIYRHRKCDETEIGTGSPDNGSLRDESSDFDRVQRRSNDSRDSKKKGSIPSSWSEKDRRIKRGKEEQLPYKRSHESRSGGPERKVQKGSEHRVNKRTLSSNDTNNDLPKYRKKSRREETVMPTISGYNLRPRIGKREESRPTIERKAQQGGPVRSRKGKERNDSPYIEERTIMPDEEVINNGKTRKGEERGQRNPCHWSSW
ncbi:uncharacterized protein TNCV_4742321 [Trichonephila clavipes]|nr:uncharacterized protein TNCV_4742321 [Trichonephila clavipes]